ncbi:metabotropic glutamate receptor 2-like isoform X2 [Bactrocera neohumeralis]|uniref:metabotropic glutamate receptor 2-like isoform X2 n=1 Tax=Bactrocera neohumeralis TaxID=98809 RepID=UPI0021656CDC|nr:metabotropic glutamate receptor 2-like isoform X2 [Bactrocera neohumeralis]
MKMTPKCEPMLWRVLVYLFVAVVALLPGSCRHSPLAAATIAQLNADRELDIGETVAAAGEDLAELMSYASENDESATNEQVVGDISEQWGAAADAATEAESEFRWQQIKTRKTENFNAQLKQPLAVVSSRIAEEQIKPANVNRHSESGDLKQPNRPLLIGKVAHSSSTLPVVTAHHHKQQRAGHHLRQPQEDLPPSRWEHKSPAGGAQAHQQQHKHKRHGSNARHVRLQHWKYKHKAKHHKRMKYARNNVQAPSDGRHWQHKHQRQESQSKHKHSAVSGVAKQLHTDVEANNRAGDELELPSLPFAETHDWHYQNDDANNEDNSLWHTAVAGSEEQRRLTHTWELSDDMSLPALLPESTLLRNYTYLVTSKPAMLQQLTPSRQHPSGQSALHTKLTQHKLPLPATETTTKQRNAASHIRLPQLPTPATFKHESVFTDHNKWQSYAADAELHAAPRSGRHRGRYTALPTLAQLPYNGRNVGGGKVFRSLPDSEDFNYDQHVQRMLAIQPQRHWPVKREAIVEGDVILGGLMMVHSREDTVMCGPIMPQGGIQALEAMLYTIDRINEASLLPNITLGAHILDDCDKDSYGLEMAVDFIKGSISNIDDAEYHCNKTQVRKVISGVVGAASSVTSIQVANLLRLFRIPQVSFFSTSPELSNKQRFEYFSRTIPSDHYQVKAMVEIVKRMGWSYVSIIYEESNYGIKAFEELEELLARHNICIAVKEKLVKDSGVAEEIAYDNIVQKLLTKPRARGAIIFGSDQEVREVMRAVRRNNATGAFSWIGSDGWSARNLVSDGNEPEVEGTLSVQPQANPVKGFEEYFLNLTVENNQRNPWFVEFWEDHFQCRYPDSLSTPYNNYNRTCTTKERLSKNTDFEDQLQFVSDAVMAFAYALRDMHRDLCGGRPSLCDAMRPTKGADLLKYLRKVQFQGLSGDHFRFDGNGDGPARYNIIHFKQSAEGLYHWVKVGEYYEGELRLNMTEVQFKLLHPKPPESVCSLPCERGQAKKYVEGESCCWHCFNCSTYQIRHPIDETQCLTCQLGTLPDASKQFCQTIPEVYLRPESAWAIGAMAFSATGILVTLFVVGVFVRHNDTPIVRASGRELSYILLAGILMCYAVTFALVLKPTNIVCAIQRFSVGFCFTVVYAALLTKTNRIARIFKAGKQSAKRPSFISPKSQLVICSFLIFIQILINGVWMVIAPSHAMYHHPTREDNLLVCDSYIDASYMIAFFYPIVLIVVCTVYAVLTRKIPEAFNESKHIGFTMYTTCVIWLAFVPLYFGTANHVPLRITSMSVTISLSASVTVACLFSPKLYIILIRPERNVRQSMMPPRYGNMHRAGTGPSSMMAAAVVTAATCAQEEKIQKHITPTNTEHSTKAKKLCEMATQTITITNIFTNLDSIAYSQIPYADQYVPNNNHQQQHEQQSQQSLHHHPLAANSEAEVVANNNKINQLQHGNPSALAHPTNTATAAATTTSTAATSATAVAAISTAASPPTLHALSNHVMLQQHIALHNCSDSATMCSDSGRPQLETTNL